MPEDANNTKENNCLTDEINTEKGVNPLIDAEHTATTHNQQENDSATPPQMPLAEAITPMDKKIYKIVTMLYDLLAYFMIGFTVILLVLWVLDIYLPNFTFHLGWIYICSSLAIAVVLLLIKRIFLKPYTKGIVHHYTFYNDYVLQQFYEKGEYLGEMKSYYKSISRKSFVPYDKENRYLIFYTYNSYNLNAVNLKDMPAKQIENLQQIFNIKLGKSL